MTEMFFYQSIDLPGEDTHVGQWDHRKTADVYLANTDLSGKTVLDIGPGSGFWTFEMERRGAKVIAVELGEKDQWDIVPHGGSSPQIAIDGMRDAVAGIQKAFWYSHEKLGSQATVVRGSIYDVPKLVQPTDIALMGNITPHLRDPFLALERVASVVKERIIVSEVLWVHDEAFIASTNMHFYPRAADPQTTHSWYQSSPTLVVEWLKILGFNKPSFTIHEQQFIGTSFDRHSRMVKHFTCTADRN